MSLGINITGTINSNGWPESVPFAQKIFTELHNLILASVDELLKELIKFEQDRDTIRISFYPVEAPIELEINENTVTCNARTNGAGPGYHRFIVKLLTNCGKTLGIDWVWHDSRTNRNGTEYWENQDILRIQKEMFSWLKGMANFLNTQEFGRFAISMPQGFSLAENHFVAAPLGFFEHNWFKQLATANEEAMPYYGKGFFPWWTEEQNAEFWLNIALVMLWTDCPWHPPLVPAEQKIYQIIDSFLYQAYSMDRSLSLPWGEWREILEDLKDTHLIERFQLIAPQDIKSTDIGFNKRPMNLPLTGEWRIVLPGYFYST